MKRIIFLMIASLLVVLYGVSCEVMTGSNPELEATQVALAVQQTQLAMDQAKAAQPAQPQPQQPEPQELEPPEPEPPEPEPPEPEPPEPEPPEPEPPEPEPPGPLFQAVIYDPKEFHCNPANGPTEITITVEMVDIDLGGNLFWRLHEKATDTKLAWEVVDMRRVDQHTRSYTFFADMMAGTNNFNYPPGMGESWFEFQIITNDASERTEVFADVTFFPCP